MSGMVLVGVNWCMIEKKVDVNVVHASSRLVERRVSQSVERMVSLIDSKSARWYCRMVLEGGLGLVLL